MKIYEKKSFPRQTKDFKVMKEAGKLTFDNAVQRNFVWNNTLKDNRMSMLVDSMLRGFPVPPMYCNCVFTDPGNRVYDFIDGKQRVTTIIKFLNDEFELVGIPVFEMENGESVDFNGLKYSELPQEFQDEFRTYSFTVYYYENMSQDEISEMFRRLNNGKSLTAIELTRANAKSKDIINDLSKHELFEIALSEKSLAGYANEDIVIKTWILLYNASKSLETKDIRPIIRTVDITDEQANEIKQCFDLAVKIYQNIQSQDKPNKKVMKKMTTKTHLLSLMLVFQKMIVNSIEVENGSKWIIEFFDTGNKECSRSIVYNSNIANGSARESAVSVRMNAILEHFNKYFSGVTKE